MTMHRCVAALVDAARLEVPPTPDVAGAVLHTIRTRALIPITPLAWWAAAAAAAAVLVLGLVAAQPEPDPQMQIFEEMEIVLL